NETLKEKITELKEGKKKKKIYPTTPKKSGTKKKPGRKPGFKGTSRKKPDHIDDVVEATCDACPHCGSVLGTSVEVTERYVEDITPPKSHVTKYKTHRYFCSHCNEMVSATPVEVIPNCRLGLNVTLIAAYLRCGLHLPFEKIRENFEICFGIKTTKTTIYNHIKLLASYYKEEFEAIKERLKESKAVYVDETGWKINGVNHWLWTFVTECAVLFTIDKRRSSDVPKEILGDDFDGVIISDFYSAYHTKLPYKKQKCLVHFLRDAGEISQNTAEAKRFYRRMKRFIKDAAKFKEGHDPQKDIIKAKKRFQRRLDRIIGESYTDPDCKRLVKRLKQHRGSLLTFLEVKSVEYHNNTAERALRPLVVQRKISSGNKTESGAETQEIMTSIHGTYKLRNENFLEEAGKFMRNQLGQGTAY
ncbi:MAG: IS66 family transposase, partial [Candidatus Methanofastidiosia archaeon]